MATRLQDPTYEAYELLAPFYDRYTEKYGHESWLAEIETIALEHGLRGSRLLDVGCGTGKSFLPMLARGYDVTAFDLSPSMVARACDAAAGSAAEVLVADVRDLPELGRFDLATALDDALNYMLSDDELLAAFTGLARNLRPGGLLVFDLNTLPAFQAGLTRDMAMETEDAFFCWRGEVGASEEMAPGGIGSAVIEVFSTTDGECWRRVSSRHVQRHHPPETVRRLLAAAGFELLSCRGQMTAAEIDLVGDEQRHRKLLYFARRVPSSRRGPASRAAPASPASRRQPTALSRGSSDGGDCE
jgi:SAM-dependent methyltransferase